MTEKLKVCSYFVFFDDGPIYKHVYRFFVFSKVYRLPHMELEFTQGFPVCMNHAILSPNGDYIIAVGDSTEVFVLSLQEFVSRRVITFQGKYLKEQL
jgi:hypothetical protein